MLPNMSNKGILVAELHWTFLAMKFLFFRVNLEVNLDICHVFEADPALPLSQTRVTLSVVTQTLLKGEKMLATVLLGTDEHPVTPKED